ncbi:head-tail connector protein [uncultured Alistipes sp.]|uniref:head-tail connector protein n=1 Tax=uncultured Alistipes sp. TaxID=538949 RepID=UPI00280469AB|nr:head-tail connector protein [uncultured Alistipes sp.]
MRVLENGEPPITMDLARQHLRVGSATHDDTLIAAKLDMAVAVAEDLSGRFIRQRSVEVEATLPVVEHPTLRLPVPTTAVERLTASREPLSDDLWQLHADDYTASLSFDASCGGMQISATLLVGYDEESLPPAIRAAVLLILGTLYDNESDALVGRSVSELPLTAEKLLLPWRVTPYGDV